MRSATRKQDWKIVNLSELDRLEKYLTLFLFVFHIWHWFYLSQLVESSPVYNAVFYAVLPEKSINRNKCCFPHKPDSTRKTATPLKSIEVK